MSNSEYVLEAVELTKTFPGVKALDKVSLRVRPGTVHALMGENGAGKSTLMKCIYGIYSPDEGSISMNGQQVHITSPRNAMDLGIAMIHQELHPVRPQTVAENIFLGRIPYKKAAGVRWVDKAALINGTKKVFEQLGLDIDPKQKVAELSTSYCQLIEIARSVSIGAKVVIMDEPTSSLTETETEILFRIIRQLKAENVAIIYISHKIDEILQISDEITIMRDGQNVGTWLASEMTTDMIVARMVGREMTDRFPHKKHTPGKDYLKVENFTSTNPHSFKNVSFTVRKGEIFGIGGLVGSQRSELMEALFGLHSVAEGKVSIDGKEVHIKQPVDAIKNGMALLTEDRRKTGIIGPASITDNTLVVEQNVNSKRYYMGSLPFIDNGKRNQDAQKYVDMLRTKTPTLKTAIKTLSGGNQQKVLLGRWLLTEPDILILDEPTRGIDVGAKYEIYELMEQMAQNGKCVIMISSEMPELMGMSDRIMVMCEGHKSGILEGPEVTDEKIMLLASTFEAGREEKK
ncbi:MAG: sugar ABC transporter ATP-binding protein [Lachnospiraceae bacterium]|nr:sugar ABC transporter ATP-binding protein [Lachnospiraceae bacterium]